jgi:solute carrier family 35 protein
MFTVLRRFSILFTMLLEASVFGKSPPYAVKASVGMMLGGAVVAALSDISFHPLGYGLVLANGAPMNHGQSCG